VKNHIFLLSASDRFNYGDVLFPIVAKHELEKLGDFEFRNIATIASDLAECGALATESYKALLDYQNLPDNSTLIVAGGEVLTANWSRLISFTSEFYHQMYEKHSSTRLENIAKHRFGDNQLAYPFVPAAEPLLAKVKLVFHAVGGGPTHKLPEQEEVKRSVEAARYFSVRERDTRRWIANHYEQQVSLVPDSVMVLSDMHPKSSLPSPNESEYACIQFGFLKSQHRLPDVLKELKTIHQQQKLAIGLLSIGNCPGHDDMKSVEWIIQHADFPVFTLPSDSINAITASIAHAKIFIGTSLHGVIVSLSYGNPFVAVNKKIRKIEAYTQAWAPEYLKGSVDFNQIAQTVAERLNQHKGYLPFVANQKNMVRKSFAKIASIAMQ